ncbi:competence type IV pilus minor pilin ComGE [Psychrobacillus sp. OK032]|uniref:competence type IV pilus minor pilin ComGE n=1 Tax=Psychrobacillus sp. OK032 TaxID=1884358 RepID=UPI0008C24AD9|nr:competence type IV pilus minor pilin ComGE [Psychrobacillus sp. OK032]SER80960.1 hypothetical protein SAMN05518872_102139 [Psychrobacillus sp. OK032]
MRNSDGFSWPETILALSIIFIIASTLLPLLNNMQVQLEEKKRKYHASVVMHEATKKYITENSWNGSMDIERVTYTYEINNHEICVYFEGMREEKSNCVTFSN